MARYRVGVIFGSRSTEHEVSIVSALQVIKFLSGRHEVTPIYITRDGVWLTGQALASIDSYKKFNPKDQAYRPVAVTPDTGLQAIVEPMGRGLLGKPKPLALDVVFPVFHGAHGEDGTIQGLLDLADIPYVGNGVRASAIAMDKITTKAVLKDNGLPALDHVAFTRADWERDGSAVLARINGRLPFPVIVKPSTLGSSIGVQKAASNDQLQYAIDVAIHYDTRILVEPCIEKLLEVNCSVLGNDEPVPSVCEQPVSRGDLLSYEDKYLHEERTRGMEGASRIIPAPISPELTATVQRLAVESFRAIGGQGIARIDLMLDQASDTVYVNEINPMPGSISFYLWEPSGVSPEQLVDRLLELAMEAHAEKRRTTYTFTTPLLQNVDMLALNK